MIRFDLTPPLQNLTSAFDSLQTYVYGIAFLVTLAGYYLQVWRHRSDAAKAFEAIAVIGVCVLFAASVSFWRPYVVNVFYYPAEELGRANASFRLHLAINHFFHGMTEVVAETARDDGGTAEKIVHFLWNFGEITQTALLGLAVQAFVYVLTLLGAFIALPFYFLQHVLVTVFFTFMPIPICALTVPALRDRSIAFMSMTASVLAWPLGFSIVAAATNTVFDVPFHPAGAVGGVAGLLEPILRQLVAGAIMVMGTLLVPPTLFFIALYGGAHIDPIMSAARSLPALGSFARR